MFFPESFFHTFFVTPFCIYNLSAVALPALLSQGICSLIGAFSQCISPGLHFAVRSKCCAFFTVGLSPYHPAKIAYALCKHGICHFCGMALLNAYAHYTISPYKKKLNFLSAVMTGLYFCGTIEDNTKGKAWYCHEKAYMPASSGGTGCSLLRLCRSLAR